MKPCALWLNSKKKNSYHQMLCQNSDRSVPEKSLHSMTQGLGCPGCIVAARIHT